MSTPEDLPLVPWDEMLFVPLREVQAAMLAVAALRAGLPDRIAGPALLPYLVSRTAGDPSGDAHLPPQGRHPATRPVTDLDSGLLYLDGLMDRLRERKPNGGFDPGSERAL